VAAVQAWRDLLLDSRRFRPPQGALLSRRVPFLEVLRAKDATLVEHGQRDDRPERSLHRRGGCLISVDD
jgi:hypothetical protein